MTRKCLFAATPWLLVPSLRSIWPALKSPATFLRLGHSDGPASTSIFGASTEQTSVIGRSAARQSNRRALYEHGKRGTIIRSLRIIVAAGTLLLTVIASNTALAQNHGGV